MTRAIVPAVAAVLLLGPAEPVSARQLDAAERPRASGPLTFEGRACTGPQRLSSGGELLAVGRSCIFLYRFDPTAELDPFRDYGVAWVQTELDPRNGWCAAEVGTGVALPRDAQGHDHTRGDAATRRPRRIATRLVVDARGSALSEGRIRQDLTLYPRRVRGSVGREGRAFSVTWRGHTARTLAFAVGYEFSASAADALLGDVGSFKGGLQPPLRFERDRSC